MPDFFVRVSLPKGLNPEKEHSHCILSSYLTRIKYRAGRSRTPPPRNASGSRPTPLAWGGHHLYPLGQSKKGSQSWPGPQASPHDGEKGGPGFFQTLIRSSGAWNILDTPSLCEGGRQDISFPCFKAMGALEGRLAASFAFPVTLPTASPVLSVGLQASLSPMEGEIALDCLKTCLNPKRYELAWNPSAVPNPGLLQPPVTFLQQGGLAHCGWSR